MALEAEKLVEQVEAALKDPTVDQYQLLELLGAGFQMERAVVFNPHREEKRAPQRLHATGPEQSGS